jgi:hypothetical protein
MGFLDFTDRTFGSQLRDQLARPPTDAVLPPPGGAVAVAAGIVALSLG